MIDSKIETKIGEMPRIYFIGVDVGTSSARAALVTSQGEVIKQHSEKITIWNPEKDHYEQSSDNIWNSVCECVRVSRFCCWFSYVCMHVMLLLQALSDDALSGKLE